MINKETTEMGSKDLQMYQKALDGVSWRRVRACVCVEFYLCVRVCFVCMCVCVLVCACSSVGEVEFIQSLATTGVDAIPPNES